MRVLPPGRRESPAARRVEPAIGEEIESCRRGSGASHRGGERVLLPEGESPAAKEVRESSRRGGERVLLPCKRSQLSRRRESPAAGRRESCCRKETVLPLRRRECPAAWESNYCRRGESCHRGCERVLLSWRRESPATRE